MKEENLRKKLLFIQQELNVPKNQYNSFGGYNFRSCEDILNAVKPLLNDLDLILILSDELIQVGERYYIKATAKLIDENGQIENVAYAREEETKKGMDGSQITGASSSYARKYALNGLFLIDDVKDSDTTNVGEQGEPTLEDAKKYTINFGKKHPGELLIDVYKNDYNYIEWILDKKQDDEYLIKCINLLDKEVIEDDDTKQQRETETLKLIVKIKQLMAQKKILADELYNKYQKNSANMNIEELQEVVKWLEDK